MIVFFPVYFCVKISLRVLHNHGIRLALVTTPAVYAVYILWMLLTTLGCKWLLIGIYQEGRWSTKSFYFFRWWFVDRLYTITTSLVQFYPFYALQTLWYRSLGLKMRTGSIRITSTLIREWDLIEIGCGATILDEVSISAAVIERGYLFLNKVSIGNDVTIFGQSWINPGAIVPDNTVLRSGSSVSAAGETTLPPDQIKDIEVPFSFHPFIDLVLSFLSLGFTASILTVAGVVGYCVLGELSQAMHIIKYSNLLQAYVPNYKQIGEGYIVFSVLLCLGPRYLLAFLWIVGISGRTIYTLVEDIATDYYVVKVAFVFSVAYTSAGICLVLISSFLSLFLNALARRLCRTNKCSPAVHTWRFYCAQALLKLRKYLVNILFSRFATLWGGTPFMSIFLYLHGSQIPLFDSLSMKISLTKISCDLSTLIVETRTCIFSSYITDDQVDNGGVASRIHFKRGCLSSLGSTVNAGAELGESSELVPLSSVLPGNIISPGTVKLNSLTLKSSFGLQPSTQFTDTDTTSSPFSNFDFFLNTLIGLMMVAMPTVVLFVFACAAYPSILLHQYLSKEYSTGWIEFIWVTLSVVIGCVSHMVALLMIKHVLSHFFAWGSTGAAPVDSWHFYRYQCFETQLLFAHRVYLDLLVGSPLYNYWLCCIGAKIGKDSVLMTDKLAAHEFITIGEGVCIGREAIISPIRYSSAAEQYSPLLPRVFHFSPIEIQQEATIGNHAAICGNISILPRSIVGNTTFLFNDSIVGRNMVVKDCPPRRYKANLLSNSPGPPSSLIAPLELFFSSQVEDTHLMITPPADRDDNSEVVASKSRKVVLLTGGTGFVGSHLLAELLKRDDITVKSIVRSGSVKSAFARQRDCIAPLLHPILGWENKVEILEGNIEEDFFGLSPGVFDRLSQEVDCIFHVAANVSHGASLDRLRSPNIVGTRKIIEFAAIHKAKHIYFTSSVVCVHPNLISESGKVLDETNPTDIQKYPFFGTGYFPFGYMQSKWAGEMLLVKARSVGVRSTIFRVGQVGSNSITGYCTEDLIVSYLRAVIHLGAVGRTQMQFALSPVDILAKSLLSISFDDLGLRSAEGLSSNAIIHVGHPDFSLTYTVIAEVLQDLGYRIRIIPYPLFRERVRKEIPATEAIWYETLLWTSDLCIDPLIQYERIGAHMRSHTNPALNMNAYLKQTVRFMQQSGLVHTPF
jgi:thioester reductase-like protein